MIDFEAEIKAVESSSLSKKEKKLLIEVLSETKTLLRQKEDINNGVHKLCF